jgi:hypothetical protein
MATQTRRAIGPTIDELNIDFELMLEAQGKSPATRKTYGTAVRQLAAFLTDRGMPVDVAGITRSTSRRSWPTCSPGAGRRRLPGPGSQAWRSSSGG